jgi:sugar lactone lactonase YvrE
VKLKTTGKTTIAVTSNHGVGVSFRWRVKDVVLHAERAAERCQGILPVAVFLAFVTAAAAALALPPVGFIDSAVGSGVGDGRPAFHGIIDPRGLSVRTVPGIGSQLYIADGLNNRVRLVDSTTGKISTVGGIGIAGFSGDGGPAVQANLRFPTEVLADASGNIYVADTENNRVRRISTTGVITTVAGNGTSSSGGDGGPATNASLWAPRGLALDAVGNLYITEFSGNRVRKVSPTGIISSVAGTGGWGSGGDGGPAINALLANPSGVAVNTQGNIYVADYNNSKIRRIDSQGTITTISGDGFQGYTGDGGPAGAARLKLPYRVAFDASGNLLVLDTGNNRVRRIQAIGGVVSGAGTISTVAGNGSNGSTGDGGGAGGAALWYLNGLAIDNTNTLYLGVTTNSVPTTDNRVRTVSASGTIQTYVGGGNGDGGPAIEALIDPRAVETGDAAAPADLFIADGNNNRVRYVNGSTGTITSIAGIGSPGFSGDGGPAVNAALRSPIGLTRDAQGNLWIADTLNNRVRRVGTNGVITTVAGNGSYAYGGDGGNPLNASLAYPYGVATDAGGTTLYVADFANNRIRKVASGVISTFAGTGGFGSSGDGGAATAAKLATPTDVALAPNGSLYIADYSNNAVRRVRSDGVIERVAGTGVGGYSGDGGAAISAKLNQPVVIAFDATGNLYIGESQNKRVRRVDSVTGIITTIVGTGTGGIEGDGGPAIQANLYRPTGLAVSLTGGLYISQSDSSRLRVASIAGGNSGGGNFSLSGSVRYFGNSAPVDAALLGLDATTASDVSTQTGTSGSFAFTNVAADAWTLTPSRNGGAAGAITAIDATVVLESAVGLRTLSANQKIACDTNGNGTVTAIDASLILQYRVGLLSKIPIAETCGTDWTFVPTPAMEQNQAITLPVISPTGCQPGSVTYNPLTSSADVQDFTGVLFGDCNGSWQTGGGGGAQQLGAQAKLRVGRLRRQGNTLWAPLFVTGATNIRAFEIVIGYDSSRLAAPALRTTNAIDGAMLRVNRDVPGRVSVALASTIPIHPGRVLWLHFSSASTHVPRSALRILHANVESK